MMGTRFEKGETTKQKIKTMKTLVRKAYPVRAELPNIFDEFFGFGGIQKPLPSFPAVNIMESEEGFTVELAVPGFKKEEIKIELDKDVLTISSEMKQEETNVDYTRREFHHSSFTKKFQLPENLVNGEKVQARYEDGILRVELPKMEEAKAKPARAIEIA